VTRRPLLSILAAALFMVACGAPPEAEVDLATDFLPFVADSTDNVGLGSSIAVTEDGTPYVAYFGFPAELAEGEVPTVRPVGSAFIPAVQLATVNLDDGIWSRGAVAQSQEFSGVPVPFGPETLASLSKLTPRNANGTAIALDAAGAPHVAWAGNTGIWYAASGDSSSIEQVARYEVAQAGPVGRPGIAVDGSTPWVAWTAVGRTSLEVHAATPGEDGWTDTVIARPELCNGCPPPAPTGIGVTPDGPVVVYVDHAARAVMSARLGRDGWTGATVDPRAAGIGLATTTDPDGTMYASYYDGDGSVVLATGDGASWSTTDVAQADLGDGTGDLPPMTGVAVDSQGTITVTWDDPAADTIRMERGGADGFEEVEVPASIGGRSPAVATNPDGSRVFVAWYDARTQDLAMAVLGALQGIMLANPSPVPSPEAGPSLEGCGDDGVIDLEISATTTVFDKSCLVAPAGEEFTITFDNQDTVNAHNIAAYVKEGGDVLVEPPPITTGPIVQELTVPPQDPGTYYFNCQAHPTTMFGALAVIEA
jgi:plastocyanin